MKNLISNVSSILREYSHWIGIFGILFGFTVSTIFYFSSKQKGEISLKFTTVKIVQSGIPDIKILDKYDNIIMSNVFGLEVIAWNSGNLSLGSKSDRVRRPLFVKLDEGATILGAVVQDTKNAAPEEMLVRTGLEGQNIVFTWQQFDPNDAFKVFIIYSATTQSKLEFGARIIDASLINSSEWKEFYPNISAAYAPFYQLYYEWRNLRLSGILVTIALLSNMAVLFAIVFSRRNRVLLLSLMIFSTVCMVGATALKYLFAATPF